MSCDMWFGTQDYALYVPTPLRGASVSAQGWSESGTNINGGGYGFHSYNSHKEFDFSWRSTSTRKTAQTMMSFYSGSFGRGKIYFLDPLTLDTNVLPARWADPSITCDFEGPSLIPGVDPLRVAMTGTDQFQLPVFGAQYNLNGQPPLTETVFTSRFENLFTNPNLVGDGTWAEVSRFPTGEVPVVVQPEDFRIRDLGDGESVMEIERVRGLTATNCVAGVSTKAGKPAVRIIPTTESANSYVEPIPPPVPSGPATLMGTLHLVGPLSGALSASGLRLQRATPFENTPQSLNEAGSYPHRLVSAGGGSRMLLRHGGTQGSGDVWWTDIGLFAGNYTGPAFSGSDAGVVIGGQSLVTRWTGTPDNSTSQAGTLSSPTGLSLNNSNSVFIPVPPGKQIHFGAFYQATGSAGVFVTPVSRGGNPTSEVVRLAPLSEGTFNTVFSPQPGIIGVYLWLGKTDYANATLTVNAIHARISDAGKPVPGERHWYGGQGNEGTRFLQPPTYINNTGRDGGQIEFAATFTESMH